MVSPPPSGPLPVFPGAEGFGTTTPAGRGGQVIKVTNLNDSGTGSLRAALQASGPRVVVFEVSGTISLSSAINVNNPYLTVAGETAPSPGITLKGNQVRIVTHDVLVQHLRFRPGDVAGSNVDGIDVFPPSYNVVVDHCSASWATDENMDIWGHPSGIHDITFSNDITSDGLTYGFLVGDDSTNVSLIGDLFANNPDRSPLIKAGTSAVVLNNVMYDANRWAFTSIGSNDEGSGPAYVSVVGNVYIPGPSTVSGDYSIKVESTAPSGTEVYLSDNDYTGGLKGFTYTSSFDPRVSTAPIWDDSLVVKNSSTVEASVLANVGARPADRDSVDTRIVNDVTNGTGSIISSQNQVGGWPTLAENSRTFTVPANPNGDDNGDGYTNLEEVLFQMDAQVEGK